MKKVLRQSFFGVLICALLALGTVVPVHAVETTKAQNLQFISAKRTGAAVAVPPEHTTRIEVKAQGAGSVTLRYTVVPEGQKPDPDDFAWMPTKYDESADVWFVDMGHPEAENPRNSRWSIIAIELSDSYSQYFSVTDSAVLDPLGFDYKNPNYDGEAPVLESVTVEPKVALPGEKIYITLRLRDASTPQDPYFRLIPPSESARRDAPAGPTAVSIVDEGNGITAFTQTFVSNVGTEYGSYSFGPIPTIDNYGNYAERRSDAVVQISDPQHPVGTTTVAGTMVAGNFLKATANWPEEVKISYQWTFSDTLSELGVGDTYELTGPMPAGELGLKVIGTWPDGVVRTRQMHLGAVAEGTLGVGTATLTGGSKVGSTLTVGHKTLSSKLYKNAGAQHRYIWLRDGVGIGGAGEKTYRTTPEDVGHAISVRVSSSANGYKTENSTTASVKVLGVLSTAVPSISGAAGIGSKYTATPGFWSPGTSFSYQWLRNGKPIAKATGKTYVTSKTDLNQILQVRVTGSKRHYLPVSKTSAAKRPVTGKMISGIPYVSGTARVGSKLSATLPQTWVPIPTFKYQWMRNGKAIKGATAKTYVPVPADLKQKISVRVTGAKTGYSSVVRTSGSKTIAKGILKEGSIKITGTHKVGTTLKAVPTGWAAGNTYHYRWERDGKRIKGATAKTYKLTKADRRHAVECVMTVKRAGFTSNTMYSGLKGVR